MAQVQSSCEPATLSSVAGRSSVREYRPRNPDESVVRQVVLENVETFFEEARRRGGLGVPEFVRRAFYKMIDCGCLAKGFARFRCTSCGFDRFVPYSCKIRQLCSSCSARRMMALSGIVSPFGRLGFCRSASQAVGLHAALSAAI
jgi:hypothetical protein